MLENADVPWTSRRNIRFFVLGISTILAFYGTFVGLQYELLIFTPLFFYIPIILASYWFPRRGVLYTVAIGLVQLLVILLYQYPAFESFSYAVITASFYILVAVSVMVSSLSRKVREKETQYRGIFNQCIAGIVLIQSGESDQTILDINTHGAEMLGHLPGSMKGKSAADMFFEHSKFDALMELIRKNGSISSHELDMKTVREQPVPVMISGSMLSGSQIVITFIDITLRKEAETAIKENEKKFRGIFETAPNLLLSLDKDLTILDCNERIQQMLGYSREDVTGRPVAILFANGNEILSGDFFKLLVHSPHPAYAEFQMRHRGGYTIDAGIHCSVVFNRGDHDRKIICIVDDITRRKNAEQNLIENEKKYRILFENSSDGIFFLDERLVDCNNQLCRLLGYEREFLIGRIFPDISPPRQPDGRDSEMASTGYVREALWGRPQSFLWQFHKKDGTPVETEVSLKSLTLKGKKMVFATLHDITERNMAERALRLVNAKLNLLSSVTRHDVFNQLTILTGFLEMVRTIEQNPVVLNYIQKAENSAETIRRQIAFSRDYQEIGAHTPQWQNISEIFRKAADSVDLSDILVSYPPDTVEVYADPLFEKVFSNLIDNSLRHGGTVFRIGMNLAESTGGNLTIIYEDNGCGIPDSDKEKIFMRGYGKNTGYGLFLIREIVSITGCTITERGTYGNGARFEIEVPRGGFREVHQAE
jgi:PAS domain S-box-containing protein